MLYLFGALAFVTAVIIGAFLLVNFKASSGNGYLLGIMLLAAIGYVLRAFK